MRIVTTFAGRALCAALVITALAGSHADSARAHGASTNGITVAHPWARATPGGAKIGAAYVTLAAEKGKADRLLSASSPAAGRVELHTHIMDGSVMKMRPVEAIAVPDGKSVLLQPGGDHMMLVDLKQPLKEGDLVKMTLVFEKAGPIEIEAAVESLGAKGPHGLDYQPDVDGKRSGGATPHGHHHH